MPDVRSRVLPGVFQANWLSGCKLWLRSDLGITRNGNFVQQWNDQSGQGNNVSQATSALQPGGTGTTTNGQFVLQFNGLGGSGTVQVNRLVSAAFSGGTVSQPNTIFSVNQYSQVSGTAEGLTYDGIDSTNRQILDNLVETSSTTCPVLYAGTSVSGTPVTLDAKYHCFVAVFNTTSSILYVDGVNTWQHGAGSNGLAGITIGSQTAAVSGAYGYNGRLAEIAIFNRILTNNEMAALHAYAQQRYGAP